MKCSPATLGSSCGHQGLFWAPPEPQTGTWRQARRCTLGPTEHRCHLSWEEGLELFGLFSYLRAKASLALMKASSLCSKAVPVQCPSPHSLQALVAPGCRCPLCRGHGARDEQESIFLVSLGPEPHQSRGRVLTVRGCADAKWPGLHVFLNQLFASVTWGSLCPSCVVW